MARTDARLELQKARKASRRPGAEPAMVVRYAAVLQGTSLPPSLACSPGWCCPPCLRRGRPAPVPIPAHPPAALAEHGAAGGPDITATWSSRQPGQRRGPRSCHEAGHDINVFRGPSHTSAGDWDRAALDDHGGQRLAAARPCFPAHHPGSLAGGRRWRAVVGVAAQMPRHDGLCRCCLTRPCRWASRHRPGFDSLPPGHAVTRARRGSRGPGGVLAGERVS